MIALKNGDGRGYQMDRLDMILLKLYMHEKVRKADMTRMPLINALCTIKVDLGLNISTINWIYTRISWKVQQISKILNPFFCYCFVLRQLRPIFFCQVIKCYILYFSVFLMFNIMTGLLLFMFLTYINSFLLDFFFLSKFMNLPKFLYITIYYNRKSVSMDTKQLFLLSLIETKLRVVSS